jgi:hypothetical protein
LLLVVACVADVEPRANIVCEHAEAAGCVPVDTCVAAVDAMLLVDPEAVPAALACVESTSDCAAMQDCVPELDQEEVD